MTHIEHDELALYTMGGVEPKRASEIEAHVDDCQLCATAIQREAQVEEALLATTPLRPCVGCKRPLATERCDHCGAVARVDRFKILDVRVQHQHGRLYLAEDENGQRVALKELCFMQAPSFEALDAFDREARILCALEHPCMPRFISSFQSGEGIHTRLYLAQEFIEGESLQERLANHYFEETEVISIGRQVLQILVFLQQRSPMVIHRDVKPANLIRRPDGSIVLVDFGAARDQGATAGATAVGTFGYMPIEQLAGLVDATTDPYALGASLIHLLTRREPWKLLEDDPWRRMNVSAPLRRVLQRLVARKTAQRYRSAAAALADLAALGTARRVPVAAVVGVATALAVAAAGGIALTGSSPEQKPIAPGPLVTKPSQCGNSPFSRRALLFNLARRLATGRGGDEALWTRLLGLVGTYRGVLEGFDEGSTSRQIPTLEAFAAHPNANGNIRYIDVRYAGNPPPTGLVADAAIVYDGDLEVKGIDRSIVIATGNLRVDRITNSIVIAGGCIDYGTDIRQSVVIAGTSITTAQARSSLFESTLASPMVRATESFHSTVFGATWIEISSQEPGRERPWSVVLETMVQAWTPQPIAPPQPISPPPIPQQICDEVSCVLDNYAGECCARFKKPSTPSSDLPPALDRTMISEGVGPVKSRVMACGEKSTAKGIVKVSVKVAPDGAVTGVTVKQTPDPALGACVAGAMQRMWFRKTQSGGTFGYPFVF